jgi:acetyl esterase
MGELNPQMAEILAWIAKEGEGRPKRSELSAPEARAQMKAMFEAMWNTDRPVLWAVGDHVVDGPRGPIRVRLYDPGAPTPSPALVYFHGGGWVIGDLDTHDGVCRHLAKRAGIRVLSVDYRLAPEHPFPAPLEDCAAALGHAIERGGALGIDGNRVAVGGDSAGANLALASLLQRRDGGGRLPVCGVLIHGAYGAGEDTESHRRYGDGTYVLSTEDMRWFWGHYLGGADPLQPLAAPLRAGLRGLPPLLVTAAEIDPLADDSRRLVARLKEAGVEHLFALWPGVTHACMHMTSHLDCARTHVQDVALWLRERLSG